VKGATAHAMRVKGGFIAAVYKGPRTVWMDEKTVYATAEEALAAAAAHV